ncbi:PUA-like domain-containing protein [Schizophyllum amplum]|uniref:PUA-like domain-containing protein n=1 Tax=Schizophyllum amplum TaxID=97359 RepID=A0A550CP32_9AGAR|nr:PUA-like domain-containing protein [Auriculariopsis ampla]
MSFNYERALNANGMIPPLPPTSSPVLHPHASRDITTVINQLTRLEEEQYAIIRPLIQQHPASRAYVTRFISPGVAARLGLEAPSASLGGMPPTEPGRVAMQGREGMTMQDPEWHMAQQLAEASARDNFGHIRGFPVGYTFPDRRSCCNAGVHRHTQADVVGTPERGCFSLVFSGQYEDDEDIGSGELIFYTGAGGRDEFTGRQIADQDMGRYENRVLERSRHTWQLIRVIRAVGPKRAPTGYRYDGFYQVVGADETKGKSGYKICQFRLMRCPGQPSLPASSSK